MFRAVAITQDLLLLLLSLLKLTIYTHACGTMSASVFRSEAFLLMLHTCNHPDMLLALIISRCHRIVAIISVHPDYSGLLLAGKPNSADLHTHVEDVALNGL